MDETRRQEMILERRANRHQQTKRSHIFVFQPFHNKKRQLLLKYPVIFIFLKFFLNIKYQILSIFLK